VDIDIVIHILLYNIHSIGRILLVNNKVQIIKHLKPVFNFLSVFNGLSLIIKIFFTIIK